MLDLAQISQVVENYKNGQLSLDQFADWFLSVSRRKFSESGEVLTALLQIDSLLSQLYFDGLVESEFREELAKALLPFVWSGESPRSVILRDKSAHVFAPAAAVATAGVALILLIPPDAKLLRWSQNIFVSVSADHASDAQATLATEPKCLTAATSV
jgi:hypothetical protein